jgi:hypothetical protein
MPALSTLLLDSNKFHARSLLPRLKQLRLLTLNNNAIDTLEPLLATMQTNFPSLSFLSLLGNVACAHQSTGGTVAQYAHYRQQGVYNRCLAIVWLTSQVVIAKLSKLKHLDSQSISAHDRENIASASSTTTNHNDTKAEVSSPTSSSHRSPSILAVVEDLSEQP